MDIRNFFKAAGQKKKEKAAAAAPTQAKPSSSSTASSSRRKVVPAAGSTTTTSSKAVAVLQKPKVPPSRRLADGSDQTDGSPTITTAATTTATTKATTTNDGNVEAPQKRKQASVTEKSASPAKKAKQAPPTATSTLASLARIPVTSVASEAASPAATNYNKSSSRSKSKSSTPTPPKRVQKTPKSSTTKSKPNSTTKRDPPLPATTTTTAPSLNTDTLTPECLLGYTFCFTGVLTSDVTSREDLIEAVKIMGGRVTTAVSSKTDYLVVGGALLEDGRPSTEGSKYKRAVQEGTVVVQGEHCLYGLCQQYDDKARAAAGLPPRTAIAAAAAVTDQRKAPPVPRTVASDSALAPTASAPIAKADNPYARAPNPYAKKAPAPSSNNPYAKKAPPAAAAKPAASTALAAVDATNRLWVDKYKPTSTKDILGNQESVRKLTTWLARWEERFNCPAAVGKAFSNPNGPWKAALLSGPPGIGKTTTATLVAYESGRDVLEFNASDVRSKKAMKDQFGDITGSHTIEFKAVNKNGKVAARKKRCIVMDEVDGMGAGDRSGMAELIQMIKNSHVPIICICNDRQAQKIRSLVPYCMDLRYRRPVKTVIANRAIAIATQEGVTVERNAAEALAESCGNDVRQVLNALQMWASDNKDESKMTYKSLKKRENSINKDAILRMGLFDAARIILEGRRGLPGADAKTQRQNFFQRNDAFFVDYSFVGLLVQQNYVKIVQGQFNEAKRTNDQDKVQTVLDRMSEAADSMSDFALVDNQRAMGMNWSLLPFTAALAVKTGYHAGGESGGFLPGFPEFSAWLGKNSTKGKKTRILHELQHHVNYKISGGNQEMRLSYLPVFRDRFVSLLASNDDNAVDQAIALMDEYGFDRDDVFESLDEFKMDPKADSFAKIDSKTKAAFTRAYNARAHKSQALVAEQGGSKAPKRKASSMADTADPDAIDDDKVQEEDDDEDDELDADKIKAMFKKKGRAKSTKAKNATTSKAKGKKKK